jgi:hypothetical protein
MDADGNRADMTTRQPGPVLLLGMHRSGTSFLAGLLAALGVHMGDKILPADAGNPRGYFEDVAILDFHKALLARRVPAMQTRADYLPGQGFDPRWTDAEREAASELVRTLERPGFWGWKEPRTCLFLEQWLDLLPGARCIAVFRHPLEVYYSFLKRRDWAALFAPEAIFDACARYNRAILAAREKNPGGFLVLHASAACANLPALSARICAFLGIEAAGEPPRFESSEFANLRIVPEQHALMAAVHPAAALAYEELNVVAAMPGQFAPAVGQTPVAPALIDSLAACAEDGTASVGQPALDAFCLNLSASSLAVLRERLAAEVESTHAAACAERDKYVADFEKYRDLYEKFYPLYENYFEAWKGTDRTLRETREWIARELQPTIDRLREQVKSLGAEPVA